MAVAITDALVRVNLDGMDAVFNAGTLQLRSGAAPGPGAAPSGVLLVTVLLPADAFAAASGRTKAKAGAWASVGLAVGTIGHYRLITASDTGAAGQAESRQEGTVGVQGATVAITSVTQPNTGEYEVTATAHGLLDGGIVEIAGHSVASLNGRWPVHDVTANTFRIQGNVGAPGTGGTVRASFDCTVDDLTVEVGQVVTVTAFGWEM